MTTRDLPLLKAIFDVQSAMLEALVNGEIDQDEEVEIVDIIRGYK